ncbi:hypothetical protein Mapa_007392 [Marchantia paleacea]|nr:hypothetical protein Mapa_007392 [Marchantia paleacea]
MHNYGEPQSLLKIHVLVWVHLSKLVRLNEAGEDEMRVGEAQAHAGTDPPACSERDELEALGAVGARHVVVGVVVEEAVGIEHLGLLPDTGVVLHGLDVEEHQRVLRNVVAPQLRVLRDPVRDAQGQRGVLPQSFLDHGLEVAHFLQVSLRHGAPPGHTADLFVQSRLNLRMRQQIAHGPFHQVGSGVSPAGEHFADQPEDVRVDEFHLRLQHDERVHVVARGSAPLS